MRTEQDKKQIYVNDIWQALEKVLPVLDMSALRKGPTMPAHHFKTFKTTGHTRRPCEEHLREHAITPSHRGCKMCCTR